MEFVLFWIAFSVAVGFFASNYRNRPGFGWFMLSLVISPLLGFVFAAVSKTLPDGDDGSDLLMKVVWGLLTGIMFLAGLVALMVGAVVPGLLVMILAVLIAWGIQAQASRRSAQAQATSEDRK